MSQEGRYRLDYQETLQQFRMLADARFKLLAFVPTVSGAAVALLTGTTEAQTRLAVGLLGFLVTLGILFYELRNSEFYDAVAHRAKCLEMLLGLPACTQGKSLGGAFNERPGKEMRFFGLVKIWHDRGLALVYGAALGGWLYLIVDSAAVLADRHNGIVSLAVAVVGAGLLVWEFHRHDSREKPHPSDEIRRLMAEATR